MVWSVLLITVLITISAAEQLPVWKQPIHRNWDDIDHLSAFNDWKVAFSRQYGDTKEEAHRFLVFLDNWRMINSFNLDGTHNYTMGINQFSDMTSSEFIYYIHGHGESCLKGMNKIKPNHQDKMHDVVKELSEEIAVWTKNILPGFKHAFKPQAAPDSIDWTNHNGKNYVTPIKNQGQCGSCWAFSATGCTESQTAIKDGVTGDDIVTLSEQELMDCSQSYGNNGCNGGLMDNAFKYIEANNGLCSESDYPYKGVNGASCLKSKCSKRYSPISGYTDVYVDYEEGLKAAVAKGPVSVAVEADQTSFQHYSSGVLDGECGTWVDHGMLVVGYGHDDKSGLDYWKVKNSWDASWGMDGYILICKECGKNGSAGECGIAMMPSYSHAK